MKNAALSILASSQSFAGLFHCKQPAEQLGHRPAQLRVKPRTAAPAVVIRLRCAEKTGAILNIFRRFFGQLGGGSELAMGGEGAGAAWRCAALRGGGRR